jgi:branched-chain amino acid transport system permease protein
MLLLQQVVNGLTLGSMYSLIALGYTLFFGVIGVINFAHGDIFMLGAFVALIVLAGLTASGASGAPALGQLAMVLLAAALACGLAGVVMERVALKPLRRAPKLAALLSSLGVAIVIREAVFLLYPNGANPQPFPSILPAGRFVVGEVIIQYSQIFILVTALVLVGVLHAFVTRSKLGRAMRSVAQDVETAEVMGVNVDRVVAITFLIGSALGGVAGVMNGMFYSSVRFDMGFVAGIKGFTAAVLGGLGNIYGAVVGGFVLGFLEVIGTAYIPAGAQYKDVFAFALLILFLVLRPQGLLGTARLERA